MEYPVITVVTLLLKGITWDKCGTPKRPNKSYSYVPGGIHFSDILNVDVVNCTFQFSKVHALSLFNISGFIRINGVKFLSNANFDTIICAYAQTGYKHCSTHDFISTGGLYINGAANTTSIDIFNCTFSNNGHFGEVKEQLFVALPYDAENSEVANGAGLKVLVNEINSFVEIILSYCSFHSNRGRGGGAVNIHTFNSPNITLNQLAFDNNTVILPYISGAALVIWLERKTLLLPTSILISSCIFQNNSNGRSVFSLWTVGMLLNILIERCSFSNNKGYSVGLIEFNKQSNSSQTAITYSNFTRNEGNALLHIHMDADHNNLVITSIKAYNNTGHSNSNCRGGFLVLDVNVNNCTITIVDLYMGYNAYTSSGGGIYISGLFKGGFYCHIQNSTFEKNHGQDSGTIIYSSLTNGMVFFSLCECIFMNNDGGDSIIHLEKLLSLNSSEEISALLLLGFNSIFTENAGTVLHLSNIALLGNGSALFYKNNANNGAVLYLDNSYLLMNLSNFRFTFKNNLAYKRGGAIYVSLAQHQCHWLVNFHTNCPNNITNFITEYLSSELAEVIQTHPNYHVDFEYNIALVIGNTIFINVNPQLSARFKFYTDYKSLFDLPENFIVQSYSDETQAVTTQPQRLWFKSPANCSNDSNVCDIPNIMLGKEIDVPASVLGYNSESSEAAKVLISCLKDCDGYNIKGDKLVSIGDKFSGISITGANVLQKYNDTVITMQLTGVDTFLNTSVNIHLIPCYPGYEYNETTKLCDCFKKNDVVSCADNTTIKRNFWFGTMGDVTTTSRCPNGFCNFIQTEISSGRIILPLEQDDQCDSHRTGPACGSCDDGYTIPFDSVECINVDQCATWKTVLVVVCTILYWIVVVILCFTLMYFKVSIGYLYGIIYYYSVARTLLGVIVDLDDNLDTFATVLLSITRVTPEFLSTLCFVKGISGIDIQAIYYVHPVAFLLIILLCVKIARQSTRFTMLISSGVIHVICLLLTLVYTSIDAS